MLTDHDRRRLEAATQRALARMQPAAASPEPIDTSFSAALAAIVDRHQKKWPPSPRASEGRRHS